MLVAALFTKAKTWKPQCPLVDKWIKKSVVYTHYGILLSHKSGNSAICNNIDLKGIIPSEIRDGKTNTVSASDSHSLLS